MAVRIEILLQGSFLFRNSAQVCHDYSTFRLPTWRLLHFHLPVRKILELHLHSGGGVFLFLDGDRQDPTPVGKATGSEFKLT